jgi:hypothetical protein
MFFYLKVQNPHRDVVLNKIKTICKRFIKCGNVSRLIRAFPKQFRRLGSFSIKGIHMFRPCCHWYVTVYTTNSHYYYFLEFG